MQPLLQLLHYSLAFVVIWTAGVLGAAEGGPIPLLVIPVAILTVVTVDRRGLWSAPVVVANALGVIAFLATGYEFFRGDLERRVITAGHILTYLTCIFLIQKKGPFQIWLLLAMSILSVAVASILTTDAWLGPALLVYVLAALWTLSVLSLYRAGLRVTERSVADTGASWTAAATGSRIRHGVKSEKTNWVNSRFVAGGVSSTVLSLLLALVFFLFIPRMWISGVTVRAEDTQPLTGFAETVSLGEVGEILESTDLVFDVEFYGFMKETPMPLEEIDRLLKAEPLFRGAVLEQYRDGRWTLGRERELVRYRAVRPIDRETLFSQLIRMQPIGTKVLFCVGFPVGALDENQLAEIHLDRRSYELHRRILSAADVMTYRVFSRVEDLPLPWVETVDARIRRLAYLASLTRFPISLDRIRQYAIEVVGTEKSQALRAYSANMLRAERADGLEGLAGAIADTVGAQMQREAAEKIRNDLQGGKFGYTLKGSVVDPGVDPLVDFLFNRKSGHCEYYASAMTMMLRSLGIPARMISGFKGGQFNSRNGRFEVRQLHAHTWVEAQIDGNWVTYDPTPASRDLDVNEKVEAHNNSRLGTLLEASKNIWGQSMQMTKDQQQRYLYQPVQDRLRLVWNISTGLLSGKISLSEALSATVRRPDKWFSWRGGVVTAVIGVVLLLAARGVRSAMGWGRGRRKSQKQEANARVSVEFYERLMSLLAQAGFKPQPAQTPREFVDGAMGKLLPRLTDRKVDAGATRELVEWFYGVRFGGETLPAARVQEIDSRLTALEQAFSDEAADGKPRAAR